MRLIASAAISTALALFGMAGVATAAPVSEKTATTFSSVSASTALDSGALLAASDYRKEATSYFSVTYAVAGGDSTPCSGMAFVGQTWNGYIEASTTVTCSFVPAFSTTARAKITLGRLGSVKSTKNSTCDKAKFCAASTSYNGGSNGKTWCNEAFATAANFVNRSGSTIVCINT
ncbi:MULTISPECIES: hypothetical protein [unclassified Micromonospora]|uniref:hypothetical protein n=1 Tax=unclassified Micromonospora TaxID=2617518 RepID=UPI0033D2A225